MNILDCIFVSVFLIVTNGFIVHGPSTPLVAPLGSSVVFPCYVDDGLLMEDLEVEWRRTDSEALVHLYQDGESRPEVQQQDYHDRAHFFTEEIQHGNFSLRLDNLRAEDQGNYTCRVYIQQDSGETVIEIKYVECLLVSGSNHSVSAYVGEDVTLNCSVDSHITPEHIEEVSWKKTHKDGDILVLLFQNNEILPYSSDEQYRGRVEFFTTEISKGNFSLRLKSVRTEDKGVYICQVFAGDLSANATMQLGQLGFSFLHIAVLVFCFAAGSGALLLLGSLIYCRSKSKVTISTIWKLQLSLVFFPNICLFLAFLMWGFTEGSLNETITCSTLYILRPLMLLWALRCLKYLQGKPKPWIIFFTTTGECAVFTLVVHSVLFSYGWTIKGNYYQFEPRTWIVVCFGYVVLICLILSTVLFSYGWTIKGHYNRTEPDRWIGVFFGFAMFMVLILIGVLFSYGWTINRWIWVFVGPLVLIWLILIGGYVNKRTDLIFQLVPTLSLFQVFQLLFSFEYPFLELQISFSFHLLFVALGCIFWTLCILFILPSVFKCLRQTWAVLLWIIAISLLNIIVVIYIHQGIFKKEKECLEWICVILFLEVLKIKVFFVQENSGDDGQQLQNGMSRQGLNAFPLCNEIMYMFGAVGLVLLNSIALTAELILKARNGERVIEDLRVIVFPSECAFVLYWQMIEMYAYWEDCYIKSTEENDETMSLHELDPVIGEKEDSRQE